MWTSISKDEAINIDFSDAYSFKSTPEVQAGIEEYWKERLKGTSVLFNKSKFRLASYERENGEFSLKLGLTDYKEYIGTNVKRANSGESLENHDISRDRDGMSDALGVTGLLVTKDRYIVFLRRSVKCAELTNYWDFPGGHPEPDNVSNLENSDLIRNELDRSFTDEVVCEVNIPVEQLSGPCSLIGILRSPVSAGKPILVYARSTSLTKAEVTSRFEEESFDEKFESDSIGFHPLSEVFDPSTRTPCRCDDGITRDDELSFQNVCFQHLTPNAQLIIKHLRALPDLSKPDVLTNSQL